MNTMKMRITIEGATAIGKTRLARKIQALIERGQAEGNIVGKSVCIIEPDYPRQQKQDLARNTDIVISVKLANLK